MRRASDILKAIREEVFGWSQRGFGASLEGGYTAATISRLESGKLRLASSHLEKLRGLTPPPSKAELFNALLREFEAALPADDEPDFAAEARRLHAEARSLLEEGVRDAKMAARQAEEAARLSEQLHERAEARRLEEAQRAEQLRQADEARRAEEAQRAEQIRQADEARRAEEAQRAEQIRQADEARRAEEAQRAEQLRQADEARRTEDAQERAEAIRHVTREARQAQDAARETGDAARLAKQSAQEAGDSARLAKQSAEVAQQVINAAMQVIRRNRYVMAALALVVSPIVSTTTAVRYIETRKEHETDTLARREKSQPEPHQAEEPPRQTVPDEEAETSALDAGTALTEALRQALPFPPHGVPGQKAAPCSSVFEEEVSGYCYKKETLSSEQVKAGYCETLRLYEPSPGWCRSHRYGYLPVYTSRKDNNSVEPE